VITPEDLYLFDQGTHARLYERLGAHPVGGVVRFGVWAPQAAAVSVVGPWNQWIPGRDPLERAYGSDLWSGVVPGIGPGEPYKLHIEGRNRYRVDKADPFAFAAELAPATASIVTALDHAWEDAAWMQRRSRINADDAPIAIYEVHLGSWLRDPADPDRLLSYGELAPRLAEHAKTLGFSHVELLPVMEHPFYGSWGYQTTGYFAPTARYGRPVDLMAFIDLFHQEGLGVILDWVPSHFPDNEHGLVYFDGSHVYEHADPRRRRHPEWDSMLFNYDRPQVRSFLLSSALFWLDRYHADGLRVDGVASMLHLDYARGDDFVRNVHGGNEDLGAIQLLRTLNTAVAREHPGAITIAEESTEWPGVTRDVAQGGLGFGMKWDMGWMHDTLNYFQTPIADRPASEASMPTPSGSSCRSRTTRWSTGSARSWTGCPATNGSASRTCGCSSPGCTRSRGRSSSSWVRSSGSYGSGITTARWTGIWWTIARTPGSACCSATSTGSTGSSRRSMSATSIPAASAGSTRTIG